jgi:hypothetical protein
VVDWCGGGGVSERGQHHSNAGSLSIAEGIQVLVHCLPVGDAAGSKSALGSTDPSVVLSPVPVSTATMKFPRGPVERYG